MFACDVCGEKIRVPEHAWAIWNESDRGSGPYEVEHVHKAVCLAKRDGEWGNGLSSTELTIHLGLLSHNTRKGV